MFSLTVLVEIAIFELKGHLQMVPFFPLLMQPLWNLESRGPITLGFVLAQSAQACLEGHLGTLVLSSTSDGHMIVPYRGIGV